jgi:hypothetical protein
MLPSIQILAAAAGDPIVPETPTITWFKDLVNWLSMPQISLPFLFLPLFIAMLLFYRQWTRPMVALTLGMIFLAFYFGSMLIDHNYFLIIVKPDNVPITMMLIATGLCLWIALRQAAINDSRLEQGKPLTVEGRDDKVLVWPDLVYTEMLCLVLASVVLILWAIAFPAPLESPANPAGPPNPSKAPWYFLGLQEMLVYFDPWMAGVLLPTMIITGLIAMPYIDTNPRGNGYYTLKQRPFAMWIWLFGFLILWMVLIVFGTFLRGPNWNFFGPYEYWDSHLQVPLTNVNLSEYFWIFLLDRPTPTNPMVRESVGILFTLAWVVGLPVLMAHPPAALQRINVPLIGNPLRGSHNLYVQMGAIRFYIMAIHLVIMGLMPLKMGLRWMANLKYFVFLPEFNLNL